MSYLQAEILPFQDPQSNAIYKHPHESKMGALYKIINLGKQLRSKSATQLYRCNEVLY